MCYSIATKVSLGWRCWIETEWIWFISKKLLWKLVLCSNRQFHNNYKNKNLRFIVMSTMICYTISALKFFSSRVFSLRITAPGISGQSTVTDNSHQTPVLESICSAVLLMNTHSVCQFKSDIQWMSHILGSKSAVKRIPRIMLDFRKIQRDGLMEGKYDFKLR